MAKFSILTPLNKRESLYSDFRRDFATSPVSGDLAIKKDEEAIKEALTNLILTDRGEWLMQPTKGGNVRATLFENNTPATLKLLEESIRNTINNYEPRVNLIDVEVFSSFDSREVRANIIFYIRNSETPVTVTVYLERAR